MRRKMNARCLIFLFSALIPATAWAATYPNRVWHQNPDGSTYYTIEDVTLVSDRWEAADSPVICEANVTVAAGESLTIDPTVEVNFVEAKGLYINGTLLATQASFSISGAPTVRWNGIYLSPASGASRLEDCLITASGGYGYCYYGCRGLGTYHGADRYAAVYVDDCSPAITGCTFTDTYGNAVEVWGGSPTITICTFNNVGNDQYAIRYDNTDIFATISGNTGSGTGNIGVSVPAGTIDDSGAWTVAGTNFPYIVTGHITVAVGKTLTLPPGATVQFLKGDSGLYVEGTLDAQGTPASPVNFTSRTVTQGVGDWNGIYFGPGAGASRLVYANVLHASGLGYCYYGCRGIGTYNGADRVAAVYINACSPEISNCLFTNGYGNGIEVWKGAPVIRDNTFVDMGENAFTIALDAMDSFPVMSGNTASGKGWHGVRVPGGEITVSGTWAQPGTGLAYYVPASISVKEGTSLTVAGGNILYMAKGNTGFYVHGTLTADGSATKPISLTTWNSTPAAGDWNGVYLAPTAGASSLRFVSIDAAGGLGSCNYGCSGLINVHGGAKTAGLYVDASNPTLEDLSISRTYGNGLEMWGAGPTIARAAFSDIRLHALRLEAGCAPVLSDLTITRSGREDWTVSIDGSCRPTAGSAIFVDNTYPGIEVRAGTTTGNTVWSLWAEGVPYVPTGSVTVDAAHTLTVHPGVEAQFHGTALFCYGTLMAEGTKDDPIIFTGHSANPNKGDWYGIYLGPEAGGSRLSWCNLSNGGKFNYSTGMIVVHGVGHDALLLVDSCTPVLSNLTVLNSRCDGMELWNSAAQIHNAVFAGNGWSGIAAKAGSSAVMTNITSAKNATGIYLDGSSPSFANAVVAMNNRGFDGTNNPSPVIRYSDVSANPSGNFRVVADHTGTNGNISADPLFANAGLLNVRLLAGSPCMDTGDDAAINATWKDMDGRNRKMGSHVDMGAYEYSSLPLYTLGDVTLVMRATCGISIAGAPDLARLNLERSGLSQNRLDLSDAMRLARKVAGLEGNP